MNTALQILTSHFFTRAADLRMRFGGGTRTARPRPPAPASRRRWLPSLPHRRSDGGCSSGRPAVPAHVRVRCQGSVEAVSIRCTRFFAYAGRVGCGAIAARRQAEAAARTAAVRSTRTARVAKARRAWRAQRKAGPSRGCRCGPSKPPPWFVSAVGASNHNADGATQRWRIHQEAGRAPGQALRPPDLASRLQDR